MAIRNPRKTARPATLVLSFAALLSSAGASAQESSAAEAASAHDWDMIAFEVKSWGAPMWQWQFSPEYGGVWVEAVSEDGAPMGDHTLEFHTLETDPQRYVALQDIFRQLPDPAPDSADCEQMMTDMAYGTVRLTRGATTTEIAWNSGCMDEDYAEFLALLREADQMVSQWGREAPVSRTEPSRQ